MEGGFGKQCLEQLQHWRCEKRCPMTRKKERREVTRVITCSPNTSSVKVTEVSALLSKSRGQSCLLPCTSAPCSHCRRHPPALNKRALKLSHYSSYITIPLPIHLDCFFWHEANARATPLLAAAPRTGHSDIPSLGSALRTTALSNEPQPGLPAHFPLPRGSHRPLNTPNIF